MKKGLSLLISLLLLKLPGFGQIQIGAADMPSINDTIRYSICFPGSEDFTVSGPNFNWDFSSLAFNSQDIYKYKALVNTPYATLAFTGMPLGAIGYKVADSIGQGPVFFKNIYSFYEKKQGSWSAVGTGFTISLLPIPAGGVYKDKDEIYIFPLTYNDEDSNTFEVKTPIGNQITQLGYYKQKGYRLNFVDGWGTVSTPYGNNIPCIRIRSEIYETDSLVLITPPISLGFPLVRVEYRWLTNTEKIPLLEVTGAVTGGNFTPAQINYRDHYRMGTSGIRITDAGESGLICYPNPATNFLKLNSVEMQNKVFRIFNPEGRLMIETMVGADLLLDISSLSPGIYHLLSTDNNIFIFTTFTKS